MSKNETQSGQTDPAQPIYSRTMLDLWGSKYPVMASLGDDWYLVAHPNWPAIARAKNWQYLGHLSKHPIGTDDCVPAAIRYDATEALMNWAVKQPTYPTNKNSKP